MQINAISNSHSQSFKGIATQKFKEQCIREIKTLRCDLPNSSAELKNFRELLKKVKKETKLFYSHTLFILHFFIFNDCII